MVLISQDGVQLPPLSFPSGGSLLSFLTCLEQGLSPEGRLDPPLLHKNSSLITWPKLKKNILPDRLVSAFHDQKDELQSQDFVFRIVFASPVSNIGKCTASFSLNECKTICMKLVVSASARICSVSE